MKLSSVFPCKNIFLSFIYSYDASISLRCVQKLKKCFSVLGEAVSIFPPVSDSPAIQPVPRYPALPGVWAVPSHSPVPTDTDQQPLWNNSSFCDRWLQRKYSEEGNSSDMWTGKNPLFNVLLFTVHFSVWSIKLHRHKITDLWSQQSSLVQNHSMLFYCNFNPSSLAVLLCCGFFWFVLFFCIWECYPLIQSGFICHSLYSKGCVIQDSYFQFW